MARNLKHSYTASGSRVKTTDRLDSKIYERIPSTNEPGFN